MNSRTIIALEAEVRELKAENTRLRTMVESFLSSINETIRQYEDRPNYQTPEIESSSGIP
jgi:hypothetical protein